MKPRPEILVLAGPTASGKTALALEIAARVGGEIVSVDSMQLYRGLDIGTAKPTPAERAAVPHHLLDVLELSEPADVYRFVDLADAAIADIAARGKVPVVAGGTGMYLRALLYGLDDLPGDRELRARLDAEYDSDAGYPLLLERLAVEDPAAVDRIGPNRRRLIRALEVKLLTGRSIVELRGAAQRRLRYPLRSAWKLEWPREELKRRIAARCRQMLDNGWIDEARTLLAAGLLETPTAHQALGYRQIGEYLEGRYGCEELAGRIALSTWQLARRQITWFRHQHPEAETLPMPAGAAGIPG